MSVLQNCRFWFSYSVPPFDSDVCDKWTYILWHFVLGPCAWHRYSIKVWGISGNTLGPISLLTFFPLFPPFLGNCPHLYLRSLMSSHGHSQQHSGLSVACHDTHFHQSLVWALEPYPCPNFSCWVVFSFNGHDKIYNISAPQLHTTYLLCRAVVRIK